MFLYRRQNTHQHTGCCVGLIWHQVNNIFDVIFSNQSHGFYTQRETLFLPSVECRGWALPLLLTKILTPILNIWDSCAHNLITIVNHDCEWWKSGLYIEYCLASSPAWAGYWPSFLLFPTHLLLEHLSGNSYQFQNDGDIYDKLTIEILRMLIWVRDIFFLNLLLGLPSCIVLSHKCIVFIFFIFPLLVLPVSSETALSYTTLSVGQGHTGTLAFHPFKKLCPCRCIWVWAWNWICMLFVFVFVIAIDLVAIESLLHNHLYLCLSFFPLRKGEHWAVRRKEKQLFHFLKRFPLILTLLNIWTNTSLIISFSRQL